MNSKFKEFVFRVLVAVPLLWAGYESFHRGGWWWAIFVTFMCVAMVVEVNNRLMTMITYSGSRVTLHARLLIGSALVGCTILNTLHNSEMGRGFIVLGAIMVICFDSFSLIVGWLQPMHWRKAIAPNESPKKTWGGFIGGSVLSWVAGIIVLRQIEANYVKLDVNRPLLYLTMILLPVVAYFGDINESMVKRRLFKNEQHRFAGRYLKDMSRLLGPHGGVSDRFDALLAVYSTLGVVWKLMVYFA